MNPVPNPIYTGVQRSQEVQDTIDKFFIDTRDHLVQYYDVKPDWFEIKCPQFKYQPTDQSNDRSMYLRYQDHILAMVVETRTEFNFVKYTFFRNEHNFEDLPKRSNPIIK